ncbi:membrane-associated protein [Kineococcus xinjiangensis]|uniref:Membrane-associated protein n=1 Tax=Kineococcus xinjiangensis TaxID=512762 RepID=A0A2S6IUM2_9ACTN|nr:DedA family protein [Kineococcus xinjiangensis]PPK97970.1 membrane-associated protein [Kineococcus xinjiangensis]
MSEWLAGIFSPDLASLGAAAVYAVVFGIVFAESGILLGFFLPGDTVLFTAGLLAAAEGSPLSLAVLVAGVTLAAVLGDAVGYWCGRRLGRPWLLRRAGRMARHLPAAESFYERWGWGAVVACRFFPWIRTFTPIVAGTARMPYPRFVTANVAGALLWGAGLVLTGYAAASVPWVKHAAYAVAVVAISASLAGPVAAGVRRLRQRRAGRALP